MYVYENKTFRSDQKLYTKVPDLPYIAWMCMIYSVYLQNCCPICMYMRKKPKGLAIYTSQLEALWFWITVEAAWECVVL